LFRPAGLTLLLLAHPLAHNEIEQLASDEDLSCLDLVHLFLPLQIKIMIQLNILSRLSCNPDYIRTPTSGPIVGIRERLPDFRSYCGYP